VLTFRTSESYETVIVFNARMSYISGIKGREFLELEPKNNWCNDWKLALAAFPKRVKERFYATIHMYVYIYICIYRSLYFWICTIAQTISGRLPTVAAQVRSQVRLCGICDWKRWAGAGSLGVLRFTLPILTPPTASYTLIIRSSTLNSHNNDSVIK
jgi:hypothetical protein